MDESAVRAIVERDLAKLARACGVPHWRIRVRYEADDGDDGATGQCTRLLDYERAFIRLDPAKLGDEEEVVEVLRHELFHIVIAPFDLLSTFSESGLSGADLEKAERVFRHAMECSVRNLERMWFGLNEYRDNLDSAKRKSSNKGEGPMAKSKTKVGGMKKVAQVPMVKTPVPKISGPKAKGGGIGKATAAKASMGKPGGKSVRGYK